MSLKTIASGFLKKIKGFLDSGEDDFNASELATIIEREGKLPPPEAEKELALSVYALFLKAYPKFVPFYEESNRNWKYYRGEARPKRPKGLTNANMNVVFSDIQNIKPIIKNGLVDPNLHPTEPQHYEAAEKLNLRTTNAWNESKLRAKNSGALVNNLLFDGVAHFKLVFNNDLRDGKGDIRARLLDNRRIVFDTSSAGDFDNAKWIADVVMGDVAETKRMFRGKAADKVKPGTGQIDGSDEYERNIGPPDNQSSGRTDTMHVINNPVGDPDGDPQRVYDVGNASQSDNRFDKADKVMRIEMWYRDMTEDEKGELVYPEGRVVTIGVSASSGGVTLYRDDTEKSERSPDVHVLNDIKNPHVKLYQKTDRFPFIQVQCHEMGGLWGMSEVFFRTDIQDLINDVLNQTHDNWRYNNNPWKIFTKQIGLKDIFTNKPGFVAEIDGKVDDIRKHIYTHQPPLIANEAWTMLSGYLKINEQGGGAADVISGRQPTGVTAGTAISQLQSKASSRFIELAKNVNNGFIDLFEGLALIAQDFDSEYNGRMWLANSEVDWDKPDDKFVEYDPAETREAMFSVEVSRKMSVEEAIALLEAAANLDGKSEISGVGELALGYSDDKGLVNQFRALRLSAEEAAREQMEAEQQALAGIKDKEVAAQIASAAMQSKNNQSKEQSSGNGKRKAA